MNAYGCVATGFEQGMIEVVRPAETIANLQKDLDRTTGDRKVLFDWLKTKCSSEAE